jgi:hypothetical protein
MGNWFLNDGANEVGPNEEDHVLRMIAAGLPESTLIRAEGSEAWKGLRSHAPFAMALERRAGGAQTAATHPPAPQPGYGPPAGYAAAPPSGPTAERVFWNDGGVSITNARAVIGGTTYALANITSVRRFDEARNANVLVAGMLFVALGVGCVAFIDCKTPGFISLLLGAAMCIAYALTPEKHWVRLGTAGAESNAIWYKDPAYAQRVVDALNQAIIHRG